MKNRSCKIDNMVVYYQLNRYWRSDEVDTELIATFLTLVQCKSFTVAAEKLSISQSTLSHRIHLLERQIQDVLVSRGRGKRGFYLTEAGIEFIPLAEQWMSLHSTILNFHNQRKTQSFRIGSVESLTFVFSPFYKNLIDLAQVENTMLLSCYTYSSFHIYNELEQHQLDFGFVVRQRMSHLLETQPLFSEKHFVIGDLGTDKAVLDPAKLDVRKELLADWSPSFMPWHTQIFGADAQPLAVIGTSNALSGVLSKQTWSIIPESSAKYLQSDERIKKLGIQFYEMTPPPNRICYKVTPRFMTAVQNKQNIADFEDKLMRYLKEQQLHL